MSEKCQRSIVVRFPCMVRWNPYYNSQSCLGGFTLTGSGVLAKVIAAMPYVDSWLSCLCSHSFTQTHNFLSSNGLPQFETKHKTDP